MNTDSSAYDTLNLANFIKGFNGGATGNAQPVQLSATSQMTPTSSSKSSGLLGNKWFRWALIALVIYAIYMFFTRTPRGRRLSRSLRNRLRLRRSQRARRRASASRRSDSLESTGSSDKTMTLADEHYKQLLNKYQ